ncbi:MAG: hypothetical protein JWN04_1721 [Myxococcaceae bacterium]|nr:hypothetical protein [Myxococcaceae bacterium]
MNRSSSLGLTKSALVCSLASLLAAACGDDAKTDPGVTIAPLVCPVVVSSANCDKTLRPIVFIHGTLGAGDNGEHIAMLFGSNGYCQDRFVAVDYNSLGGDPSAQVDALIAKVLAATGQKQVDLMGHSQGGLHGYQYLTDAKHPERVPLVANYIHLAGGAQQTPIAGVRTMSIVSNSDKVAGLGAVEGSTLVTLDTQDHMGVAESSEAFGHMYNFLIGHDPQYLDVQCGDEEVTLAGKSASLGDNVPAGGSTVEFYELGSDPWKRGLPVATAMVAADGTVPPLKLKRGVAYESRLVDTTNAVVGHMYYTPWKRDDLLMRALVPAATGLASTITSKIPRDDAQSVIIVRYNESALRSDLGNTLTFDGKNALLAADATAETCTVGYFTWDDNHNGITDLTDIPGVSPIPLFVKAVDVFTDAKKPKFVDVTFNGVTLKVPNWPSMSQGPTIVMFQ